MLLKSSFSLGSTNTIFNSLKQFLNYSTKSNIQLEDDELFAKIDNLSIFDPNIVISNSTDSKKNSRDKSGPLNSKSKQDYLSKKLPKVFKIFGPDDKYPNLISHHIPFTKTLSPFHDGLPNIKPPQKNKRLSVTSLLTKQWCEIRSAYDIYSQMNRFTTVQLLTGTKQHTNLEMSSHPINLNVYGFNSKFNVPTDKLIDQWFETIQRLLHLFLKGQAREIPCFAFVNINDPNFKFLDNNHNHNHDHDLQQMGYDSFLNETNDDNNNNNNNNKCVMISGIIDHLKLKYIGDTIINSNPENDDTVNEDRLNSSSILSENINLNDSNLDLGNLIQMLNDKISNHNPSQWQIDVADVKTRQTFKIPTQTSVLKGSKLQVMYYNQFLKIMGQDPNLTYHTLLLNAYSRGYNIDEPLNPLKIMSSMIKEPFLIPDMKRLQMGKDIGFPSFDNYYNQANTRINNSTMDLSSYYDQMNNPYSTHLLEFCNIWEKSVTLRYLAMRLAQLYHLVGKLLSNDLVIEYYCKDKNFHNIHFQFNNDWFKSKHINSLQFWFGKRDIEPFEPNLYNFNTFCKTCDYASVCSWKTKGEELCNELGNTLKTIIDDNHHNSI